MKQETTATMKPTNEQIAADFRLWGEYVDPSGIDTEEAFNAMSLRRRIEIIRASFPAATLGRRGGAAKSPEKTAAARANGKQGGRPAVKGPYSPTLHRDRSVTYWSVYRQQWIRASSLPDEELAALGAEDRVRIMRHLGA